jgi:hypothetical protein
LSAGLSATQSPIVLHNKLDGEWPADHYPVIADVMLD